MMTIMKHNRHTLLVAKIEIKRHSNQTISTVLDTRYPLMVIDVYVTIKVDTPLVYELTDTILVSL